MSSLWKTNSKIVSEYDQEIPQLQTADIPKAPRGRATQTSQQRFFVLILTKAMPKRVFFSILALTLTKALPQRAFFFNFCLYSNQSPPTKSVLLYFCPYFNQSPATKGVFLYFYPYSNHSPTIKGVFLYFCPNLNQSPAIKGVFFLFSLILPKVCQKGCFFFGYFLPLFYNQSSTTKSVLLYFCPSSNQRR